MTDRLVILIIVIIILIECAQQNSKLKAGEAKHIFKLGTAEKKLLIVFSYYILLSSIALTSFTLTMRNAENLARGIQVYFFCQQGGFDPEDQCTRDYMKYSRPFLTTMAYALLGLFPVVNLIYAINLKDLKAALHKWLPKLKKKTSHSSGTHSTGSTAVVMSKL